MQESIPQRGAVRCLDRQGVTFCLIQTGMGLGPTRKTLLSILAGSSFRTVVTTGYCGGLTEEAVSGQMILYRESLLWDPEDSPPISYQADPDLWNLAVDCLDRLSIPHISGKGITVNRIVSGAEEKSLLGKRYGCAAVDMESAAVFQAAQEYKIPCLALRVVLDEVGEELPDFNGRITPAGNLDVGAVTLLSSLEQSRKISSALRWKRAEKKIRIHLQRIGELLPQIFR